MSNLIIALDHCSVLQEVESKFGKYGDVRIARIVRNPYNNESRGFGFVEMADETGTDRVGHFS